MWFKYHKMYSLVYCTRRKCSFCSTVSLGWQKVPLPLWQQFHQLAMSNVKNGCSINQSIFQRAIGDVLQYFSTNPFAFSFNISAIFHVCIRRGTIITLLQFFSSFVYRFLQDFNKDVDFIFQMSDAYFSFRSSVYLSNKLLSNFFLCNAIRIN